MARVAVPTAKASVFDTPAGLLINIPSTKNWFVILFIGFWLCGWLFGEVSVIRQLATGKTAGGISLFMVAWLGGWTVGGAAAIYFWLWNIAGHEIVSLTPTSLTLRRDILGFGRSNEYDLPSVKNLRIAFTLANTNLTIPAQSFGGGGSIAFDYGAKTFRFGGGLDDAEAAHLIDVLKSRYPFEATAQ
jgi:hypothetical protein